MQIRFGSYFLVHTGITASNPVTDAYGTRHRAEVQAAYPKLLEAATDQVRIGNVEKKGYFLSVKVPDEHDATVAQKLAEAKVQFTMVPFLEAAFSGDALYTFLPGNWEVEAPELAKRVSPPPAES